MSVQGVDGYIIGPYDLSCSMGIPGEFHDSRFIKTIEMIQDVGIRVGCPSGVHVVEPNLDELNNAIDKGFVFIAYSVDIRMLDTCAREGMMAVERSKVK